jgi:hypothetical protein
VNAKHPCCCAPVASHCDRLSCQPGRRHCMLSLQMVEYHQLSAHAATAAATAAAAAGVLRGNNAQQKLTAQRLTGCYQWQLAIVLKRAATLEQHMHVRRSKLSLDCSPMCHRSSRTSTVQYRYRNACTSSPLERVTAQCYFRCGTFRRGRHGDH